jgi:hypothetical protein
MDFKTNLTPGLVFSVDPSQASITDCTPHLPPFRTTPDKCQPVNQLQGRRYVCA